MKRHSFLSHTPEEMRQLSNLGHIIEGALFAVVGLLTLLGNLGTFTWVSLAWPILILTLWHSTVIPALCAPSSL